jgi:hypothetical protein
MYEDPKAIPTNMICKHIRILASRKMTEILNGLRAETIAQHSASESNF